MSETPTPDWHGAACDLLKETFGEEAGAMMEAAPAKAALLERAIQALEQDVRCTPDSGVWRSHSVYHTHIKAIAEARGETPEQTLARLRRPPRIDDPPRSNPMAEWERVNREIAGFPLGRRRRPPVV